MAVLSLHGCGRNDVIPKDDMTSMLYEMYLLDGFVEHNPQLRAAADSLSVYAPVLEKYGYDRDFFEKSLRHYISHGSDLPDILKEVMARMNARVEELNAEMDVREDAMEEEVCEEDASHDGEDGVFAPPDDAEGRARFKDSLKNGRKKVIEGREKEDAGEW